MVAVRQEGVPSPEIGLVPLVTSANFENFTRGIGPVPAGKNDFASHLYLPQFTQDLQALYAIDTPAHVYHDDDRAKLLSIFDGAGYSDPGVRRAFQGVGQQMAEFANLQGNAEYGMLYYFDKRQQKRVATPPFSNGMFDELQPNIGQVVDQGNMPMILVHAHPDDPFLSEEKAAAADEELAFSYDDAAYWLIANGVRAQVLLGRGKALLGCTTDNTPVLNRSQLNNFLVDWGQALEKEGGDERRQLEEWVHVARQNALHSWGQRVQESNKVISLLNVKRQQRVLSPNEEVSLTVAHTVREEAIHLVAEDPDYKAAQHRYFEFLTHVDRDFARKLLDTQHIVTFETYDLTQYKLAA